MFLKKKNLIKAVFSNLPEHKIVTQSKKDYETEEV